MIGNHLVRVGAMGVVGRFHSHDGVRYPRLAHVVLRTRRGLETGSVLAGPDGTSGSSTEDDGIILRRMTIEDHLLQTRLQKNRLEALEACSAQIEQRGLDVVLVDAEHLFDGRSLLFYFLGTAGEEVEQLTNELAATYDAAAGLHDFAELVSSGCGPDCGVGDGNCTSCGTGCKLSAACGK